MRNKRYSLNDEEMQFICSLRRKDIKSYIKNETGYRVRLTPEEYEKLKKNKRTPIVEQSIVEKERQLDSLLEGLKLAGDVELREIRIKSKKEQISTRW